MYFDAPAPAFAGKPGLVEGLLIFASAVAISPVGMLAMPWLSRWTGLAAGSLF